MSVELLFKDQARTKILEGVIKLAEAVKSTLGPKGRNVLIEQRLGNPITTKDGVTVARSISFEDQYQNLGAQVIREAATKTNDVSGDGTTTATVLAEAIYKEGVKNITSGCNPMELKSGIEKATQVIVDRLKSISKAVSDKKEIAQIATIAANGDLEVGTQIADAMEKVGNEGIVTIEESKTSDTTLEVVDGMQFPNGFMSPYFVTDQAKQTVVLDDCFILLYEKRLSELQKLVPLLEAIQKTSRPLLILAEDLETAVLSTLVVNKIRGSLNNCAVKAPSFGVYKKDMLQDIAILTGGLAITEDLGIPVDKITIDNLGRAKKVTITKDSTTIVEGYGDEQKVKDRVALIRQQITTESSDYAKERLQDRLAKLVGGVAVISVGATTESELKEKKYRIEDALQATRAAIEEGIVPGGGTALVSCVSSLDEFIKDPTLTSDEVVGVKIIRFAIQEPLRHIALNAGVVGEVILEKVKTLAVNEGYNARTGVYENLIDSGVVDPVKVTRVALQNAASVAGLLLTTDVAIIEKKKEEKNNNQMM